MVAIVAFLRAPWSANGAERLQGQQVEGDVRRGKGRLLPRPVIGGRDLDDVRADQVDAPKHSQESERFGGREARHLRRAGSGCERRVEKVDVEGQEDRSFADLVLD